jgi:hypothetical protein
MEERRLELEPAVTIGGHELIPIAWTVGRPVMRGHALYMAMCREALGVIVREDASLRVLMADGRVLTTAQLMAEQPSLRDAVSAL